MDKGVEGCVATRDVKENTLDLSDFVLKRPLHTQLHLSLFPFFSPSPALLSMCPSRLFYWGVGVAVG